MLGGVAAAGALGWRFVEALAWRDLERSLVRRPLTSTSDFAGLPESTPAAMCSLLVINAVLSSGSESSRVNVCEGTLGSPRGGGGLERFFANSERFDIDSSRDDGAL